MELDLGFDRILKEEELVDQDPETDIANLDPAIRASLDA